MINIPLVLTE